VHGIQLTGFQVISDIIAALCPPNQHVDADLAGSAPLPSAQARYGEDLSGSRPLAAVATQFPPNAAVVRHQSLRPAPEPSDVGVDRHPAVIYAPDVAHGGHLTANSTWRQFRVASRRLLAVPLTDWR
jgi:hypothetical protein